MNKSIFLAAIAAISLICTFGCKKDADIDGFNSYNLHDVTGLVVVNGSSLKKKLGDNWLSIDIKNREAQVESAAEQEQEPSVSSEYEERFRRRKLDYSHHTFCVGVQLFQLPTKEQS